VLDEIEVLQLFRDEMPGPSTDAWARARSAVAAARLEEEPAQRRSSPGVAGRRPGAGLAGPQRGRGRGRWQRGWGPGGSERGWGLGRWEVLLPVAAVAAVVAALVAVALPASPVTGTPGAGGVQQARETAYVVSRVGQALSVPVQRNLVGYARTKLPPGGVIVPGPANVQITLRAGVPPAQSAGSVVSWSYRGTSKISVFTPVGQRVMAEWTATARGARQVSVTVNYRLRNWWSSAPRATAAPPGTLSCGGRDVLIGPGDWAAFIRTELGCGGFVTDGRQRVDGVDAIKMTGGQRLSVLWVDPVTYLPVRALLALAQGRPQTDFRWLSPTPARLAGLKVTVPIGFRQVRAPP
jgi:hypothetical protein